jgi:hypothetical protein
MVGTFRQHKRMLIAVNVIFGFGILCCIVGFIIPAHIKEIPKSVSSQNITSPEEIATTVKPIKAYEVIMAGDIRAPLYDPKPVKIVKTPPPKPQLTVNLLGTVLEDGFTYAILKNRSGKTSFVSIGESLDGAEVTKIEKDSATIKFSGDLIVLKVKGKEEK